MITILFLACNPQGTERIAFDEEFREIEGKLRSSEYRDKFNIKQGLALRLSDLQGQLLRYKPNIVHFSGHGSTSNEIILQDDSGVECPVPPEALSDLFSKFKNHCYCVVLNSCFSQVQAEAISKHIPYVIGMSDAISDQAAISFAAAFYQALGYGKDLKTAFELGCNQIHIENLGEQDIPKLLYDNAKLITTIDGSDEIYIDTEDNQNVLDDNLPSRERIAVDFVGRKEELSTLGKWFGDAKSKIWVLAGYGGKGKTAIAYEFGVNIKNKRPKNFHNILWLSAKRKKFIEGEIIYIDDPDFIDLDSAIDKLLIGYGFKENTSNPLEEKKDLIIQLLTKLPALLIIDDVDSLEGNAEDAITFFTMEVTKTPSKTLLTSRRALFGLGGVTTQVEGFSHEDGVDFIKSRLKLFELNPRQFDAHMEKIVKVTDGSPLYIEELLRFCSMGVGIKDAISAWEGVDGDIARAYSIKREFEMFSNNAKQVLLACCINRSPSTVAEISVITGLKKDLVIAAVEEIKKLFLLPKPTIIKEAPRFDVNINTRSVVVDVMKESDIYKKIDTNIKRLSGELHISGKRKYAISEYLRYSSTLIKLESLQEAEKVVKEGIVKFGEDPDLIAQLGRIYSRWKPSPRLTDAKSCFRRASELKCLQENMYHHWWSLECKEKEWTNAIDAAESGLKQFPDSWLLKYQAGYAHSRLGSNLKAGFQRDRARYQLKRAHSLLENAMQSVKLSELDAEELELHSDILQCLVLTAEAQGNVANVKKYLKQWLNEHPDSSYAQKHKLRLKQKFSIQIS